MDDGWKFAEKLLGVAAEALKQRAQYKTRLEEYQHSPVAGATIALIEATTRDAALEEAAREIARRCPDIGPAHVVFDVIRALKSTPAPKSVHADSVGLHWKPDTTPRAEVVADGVYFMNGEVRVRVHHLNGCARNEDHPGHCYDSGVDAPKPSPVQCLVPGCDRPHQHEGPHEAKDCPEGACVFRNGHPGPHIKADAIKPVVHDFGWALAQMKQGKRVRRKEWEGFQFVEFQPKANSIALFDGPGGEFWHWHPAQTAILATDWQVVP